MPEQDPFDVLQRRLRAGDQDAAGQVFRCFAQRLVALARSRLDRRLRQKVDPEDVVQSALRSFFLRCADGQFDFASTDQLWSLLVLFTVRKCRRQVERFQADRRDVRREAAPGDEEIGLAREPTPEEAALLADTVEQVMGRLDSALKRRVFEMSLQGYTVPEIGAALGYYERGVLRVRAEVRALLQELSAG
jgi:DNA-directed RNA polymerase specialized sigma24 family protein